MSPARSRRMRLTRFVTPNAIATATPSAQPQASGRYDAAILPMCGSKTFTVPVVPSTRSCTPCQTRKPASVTTNAGTPMTANQNPWKAPSPAPSASMITVASHHG